MKAVWLGVLAMMLAGVTHAGTAYRWVDEKGRVHFSDQPAPKSQQIKLRDSAAKNNAPQRGGPAPTDGLTLPNAKGAPPAKALVARAEACAKKREQLASYLQASTVTETDALGRAKLYTADEKAALIQRMQAQVRELCDDSTPLG